jgi:hypothetical protein
MVPRQRLRAIGNNQEVRNEPVSHLFPAEAAREQMDRYADGHSSCQHGERPGPDQSTIEPLAVCFRIVSLLAAFELLWPPLAIARCVDLGITSYWIVPIAASYLVAIAAVFRGANTVAWVASAIAVLAQVPFVFLSPPPAKAAKEKQAPNEKGS